MKWRCAGPKSIPSNSTNILGRDPIHPTELKNLCQLSKNALAISSKMKLINPMKKVVTTLYPDLQISDFINIVEILFKIWIFFGKELSIRFAQLMDKLKVIWYVAATDMVLSGFFFTV